MKRSALFAAVCLPALVAAAGTSAKTLVYCSEGSPENFYPGVNTTGTSFDANEPDLQPARRVRARRHQGRARASPRSGTSRADGTVYTFHLRKGVKWHSQQELQADPRLQRRRRVFTFERQWKEDHPYLQGHEPEPLLLQRHGHAQAVEVGREGRRLHGQVHAEPARGAVPGQPRDGVRRHPVEGICRRDAEGRHAGEDRPGADRHRPVLPRRSTRRTRSSATRPSPSTGAARRRSTTSSSRSRRTRRCAGPSSRRANAT